MEISGLIQLIVGIELDFLMLTNINSHISRNYERGIDMKLPYGYMIDREANIALDENKCETIRMIFGSYLSGLSLARLSEMLEEKKIASPTGKARWTPAMLSKLLFNRKYIAVVGMEQYFAAQFEKDRRSKIDQDTVNRRPTRYDSRNVLSGLLVCAECGRSYRRVQRASGEIVWRCANRVENGNMICKNSPTVLKTELISFLCDALDSDEYHALEVKERVEMITVAQSGKLELELKPQQAMTHV